MRANAEEGKERRQRISFLAVLSVEGVCGERTSCLNGDGDVIHADATLASEENEHER